MLKGAIELMLSTDQLQHYHEMGFVRCEAILPTDFCTQLGERLNDYAEQRRPLPLGMRLVEQQRHWRILGRSIRVPLPVGLPHSLRKITNLEHDELSRTLMFDPRVLDLMEQILGPDIKLQRIDAFYKSPRYGWAIGVHQDAVYWPLAPISTPDSICNAFCFLDDATVENGCLGFLPGRHREGPLRAQSTNADSVGERHIDLSLYSESEKVWVPCNAGDVVFFHGMTPHFSGRNRASTIRRAISISCLSARLRHAGFSAAVHGHNESSTERDYIQLRGQSFPGCI